MRWISGLGLSVAIAGRLAAQEQILTKPAVRLDHPFSSISGLRELPDGRVLVSDGIDDLLLRIDFAANRIDTLGRAGQGPGEYKTPDALYALPGGATLMVDLGNARLNQFDAAGKYQQSIPIAQGGGGGDFGQPRLIFPRGTDQQGRIYYQPLGGARGDSAAVIRWDRAAGRFDTLARVKLPQLIVKTSGGPSNRNVQQRPPPYPTQETWAVAPDGRLALIRAPVYRVEWVLPNGSRAVGKPVAGAPVPVGDPEKREYLAEAAANGLSVMMENNNGQVSMRFSRGRRTDPASENEGLNDPNWPATKPAVTGTVTVAPDGRLWVERSGPAGAARSYDLFGAAGDPVARVVLPQGRRLVAVGEKGVYARHTDRDGVSFLERYSLK